MSAGSGITHSEFNREPVETRLFQIWIQTDQRGVAPGWGARPFPRDARAGQVRRAGVVRQAQGFERHAHQFPRRLRKP